MELPGLRRIAGLLGRRKAPGSYRPVFRNNCDHSRLVADAAEFLGLPAADAKAAFGAYQELHRRHDYARRLGERRTLCFEEAFLLFLLLSVHRPRTIVEIGTQYGKSTRRILDMRAALALDGTVVCFDVVDQVREFRPDEAQLVIRDVTDSFAEDVLAAHAPGLIYLDARPRRLLENVIRGFIDSGARSVLAIHDCAPGLCNPQMALDPRDPDVTSETGVWERWVLAEIFGVADPLSAALDDAALPTHRLRIFGTRHGLALVLPRSMGPARPAIPAAG